MTAPAPRWRCVLAPGGKLSVLSDIVPGPRLGQPGELERWQEVTDPPLWTDFVDACETAAKWNGRESTAGMGPREAAEGGGAT